MASIFDEVGAPRNRARERNVRLPAILLPQFHPIPESPEDDLRHIQWLPVFSDRRCIKVDGKPVFIVYRVSRLRHAKRTFQRWRKEAVRFGLPGLFLVRFEMRNETAEYGRS